MSTQVEDPSKYGVIVSERGKISRFVEKPQQFMSDKINAGIYLFNCSIVEKIPDGPCSLERDVFPFLTENDNIWEMSIDGYWMDIG
jgi:mannose-1-phosphate guanylyltransferase